MVQDGTARRPYQLRHAARNFDPRNSSDIMACRLGLIFLVCDSMQQTAKPVSKLKVVLLWLALIGNLVFWLWFWGWRHPDDAITAPAAPPNSNIVDLVTLFILGGIFLTAGLAAYAIVIVTNCFTVDFNRPFFAAFKGKLYLAKIVVPILVSVGAGLMLGVVLDPVMHAFGLGGQVAFMLPLFMVLVPIQIAQMWINVWTPLTKRLIARRLTARGLQPAKLQGAVLVGISDPQRSSFKKLTLVEDDIGALWIGGGQLVYWGDTDQFAFTPGQILQRERRADAGSTSMLSGTAHVILHVQLPNGSVRQIRFHTEGHWTLGHSRRAMDALSAAIDDWQANPKPVTPPPIPVA